MGGKQQNLDVGEVPVYNCLSVHGGHQPGQSRVLLGWLGPAPPMPVPPGTGGSVDLTPGLQLFLFAKPRGEERRYARDSGESAPL